MYKLWTDADNNALIKESLPWFLETYNSFPKEIFRADVARYVYMYVYGGVYVDLDFESLKPLDALLCNTSVTLAFENDQSVANCIMASAPGHPFWIHLLTNIVQSATNAAHWHAVDAIKESGPMAVSKAYWEFSSKTELLPITVTAPGVLVNRYLKNFLAGEPEPCAYQGNEQATFNATACKAANPEAYAVSYWTGSWQKKRMLASQE